MVVHGHVSVCLPVGTSMHTSVDTPSHPTPTWPGFFSGPTHPTLTHQGCFGLGWRAERGLGCASGMSAQSRSWMPAVRTVAKYVFLLSVDVRSVNIHGQNNNNNSKGGWFTDTCRRVPLAHTMLKQTCTPRRAVFQ